MQCRTASTAITPDHVRAACLCLLLASLTACQSAAPPPSRADNFPVVEPFAIDRAGSKVVVEFTLPNAMDGDRLRPVFIGFRGIDKKGGFSDQELTESIKLTDYLGHSPLPVKMKLWRLHGKNAVTLLPQELHYDIKEDRFWYEPIATDGVVTHHEATGDDAMELTAIGQFDLNKTYYVHQIARIIPPSPGRYRLQIESLQTHPVLHGLRYELLVSHHHAYGIR